MFEPKTVGKVFFGETLYQPVRAKSLGFGWRTTQKSTPVDCPVYTVVNHHLTYEQPPRC